MQCVTKQKRLNIQLGMGSWFSNHEFNDYLIVKKVTIVKLLLFKMFKYTCTDKF
jgi:hypothetical protein